jgi:hypothetical protein
MLISNLQSQNALMIICRLMSFALTEVKKWLNSMKTRDWFA